MELHARDFGGSGTAVVMLHGLLGSSMNWAGVGRRLSGLGHCFGLDLRNHGDSPHSPLHTLPDCMEDVRLWVETHVGSAVIVGHSMGGLVGMGLALSFPKLVPGLVVVDIAPRAYAVDHEHEFAALTADISHCRSRADLDAVLAPMVPEQRLRSFLLTNAVREGDGFRWRLEPDVLRKASLFADAERLSGRYEGPALFVLGGRSGYVLPEDHVRIKARFPGAEIRVIAEADHWVHTAAPEAFVAVVAQFVQKVSSPL